MCVFNGQNDFGDDLFDYWRYQVVSILHDYE